MNEYEQRQEAIRRYLSGEKVSQIAQSLKKRRKWVYHWLGRFIEKKGANWYEDLSKAKSTRTKIY